MAGMVATAHSLGLKAGWYANNCICKVAGFAPPFVDTMMAGTVKALRDANFDAIKLDSCGQLLNLTRWNELFNASGPGGVMVDSCHLGGDGPVRELYSNATHAVSLQCMPWCWAAATWEEAAR